MLKNCCDRNADNMACDCSQSTKQDKTDDLIRKKRSSIAIAIAALVRSLDTMFEYMDEDDESHVIFSTAMLICKVKEDLNALKKEIG